MGSLTPYDRRAGFDPPRVGKIKEKRVITAACWQLFVDELRKNEFETKRFRMQKRTIDPCGFKFGGDWIGLSGVWR